MGYIDVAGGARRGKAWQGSAGQAGRQGKAWRGGARQGVVYMIFLDK
jgi:hypothetical protein